MRPLLDVRHLQMLVAIDETGSVAEAAYMLGVTPSALSHRIKEAERRLDLDLFEKIGRGIRLTPPAIVLSQSARDLLTEMERLENYARSMGQGVRHVVRMCVGTYNAYHWFPAFMRVLEARHPGIEIDIVANATTNPAAALVHADVDIALMSDQPLGPGLQKMKLFEDEQVLAVAPEHHLAGRDFVTPEDLAGETDYTYSFNMVPGYEGELFWSPSNMLPRRMVHVESVDAIVELVKAMQGVSILSRWALTPSIRAGEIVACRLGEAGIPVEWSAVVRTGLDASSPVKQVVNALGEWYGATLL